MKFTGELTKQQMLWLKDAVFAGKKHATGEMWEFLWLFETDLWQFLHVDPNAQNGTNFLVLDNEHESE